MARNIEGPLHSSADAAWALCAHLCGDPRGIEVAEAAAQNAAAAQPVRLGKTNREIAQQLFLSVNTVETHLRHVYGKLGIHRRWELIAREALETRQDERRGP